MKQTNERLCALAQKGDAAALDSLMPLYKKLDMKNHQLCFHLYGFR